MLNSPIIIFDGYCNLCNRCIGFIIRHDKQKKFRFVPMQSEAGKNLLKKFNIVSKEGTAVLIDNEKVYLKSTIALKALKHLGGIFYLIYMVLSIIPSFVRNYCYDCIAHNRYKLCGKRKECITMSGAPWLRESRS